jgi:hypothetical protein
MAVLDPQTYIDQAQDWCCVPQGDMMYAILAALIDVGNGDAVPTDVNELMAEVACLKCAIQPGDVGLLILGAVSNITGGGGGGTGGVTCSTADPVAAPTNSCTLHYRTDNGALFAWNGSAWITLIAA